MYEITYNPDFVPRQSLKASFTTATIDKEEKYFLKNHETGALYDFSEFVYNIWNLIDGKRSVKKITEEMAGMYKNLRSDLIREALLYFAEQGVLEAVLEPVKMKRLEVVSAFMVRVSLIWESKGFIQSVHRAFRPLLRRPFLWASVVFVTVMGLFFAGTFVSIFIQKENFEIMGSTVVGFFFYYFIVLAPIIAVHEIAHGLALVHYGGEPREMGTGLYFFGPMFYIDVTDVWALSRFQRIMVFAAGSISTFLIGATIMIVQYVWQFSAPVSHILTMAVFYCFYGLIVDLSPLLEADGYHILSDIVKIPDLRDRSFTYLRNATRKLFKKTSERKREVVTNKTKTILVIYAILAAFWGVYLIFRSLIVVTYMSQDTVASVLNVSSAIIYNNPVTMTAIVLSIASVLYFGMVMSGYGLMVFMAFKKAFKRTLRFEEIHDRDLSVFLYLPKNVPPSLFKGLRRKVERAARNFTQNFSVRQTGSMCAAVLRLSGTRLAVVQIKDHFRHIEKRFADIYRSFLNRHKNEILKSVGIYSAHITSLATLLSEMGKQAESAGTPEAKLVVSQIIDRQAKNALYVLHSVYGRIWTIELPPNLLHEMGNTLLPTLLVEDLSITDLYDEVEDFKKRTVYGFDSLAKLAIERERDFQEALAHPQKYQVISSFEPIKGRLILVGRTEQMESVLDSLGGLFVCQTWCGYLDNLLSEINLSLLVLNRSSLPAAKSIRSMKNGELVVLEKCFSTLLTHEKTTNESLMGLRTHSKWANRELENLGIRLQPNEGFKVGLLNATLRMNTENLTHLPSQFENFGALSRGLYAEVKKVGKTVKRELEERIPLMDKKKKSRLALSPFFIVISIVLAILGVQMFEGYVAIMFLASALLLQLFYWANCLLLWRTLNRVDRYPSAAFLEAHSFILAFAESLYMFTTAANVLAPIEPTRAET